MIKEVIENIFVNGHDKIYLTLDKYGLVTVLNQLINKVYSPDFVKQITTERKVGNIATSFLTSVNSIITNIPKEEKEQVERYVADIAMEMFKHIFKNSSLDKSQILAEIKISLTETCEFKGWNAEDLFKIIKIDLLENLAVASSSTNLLKPMTQPIVYYSWNTDKAKLDFVIDDLKTDGIIKSKNDFRKLFSPYDNTLKVEVNRDYLEFLMILIIELLDRNRKWITMKGGRGHFMPIKDCCVDFGGRVLLDKEPKRIVEKIKKNPSRYVVIKGKVDRFLQNYV